MLIVDTSVMIDHLAGKSDHRATWLQQNGPHERVGITSLTLCEILRGVRSESHAATTRQRLMKLEIFDIGASQLAVDAARNFRYLRSKGLTVRSLIDCLIATFCLEQNHILLHKDRDFDAFEAHLGLRVLHPPKPV